MKSMMKFKSTAISIATVLTFAMISLFGITPSGSATSETLNFPAGPNQNVNKTFQAPRGANVNVVVSLKNNGVPGVNSAKRLTAKLFAPDGLLSDAKELSVNPGKTTGFNFVGKFTSGSSCGNWKVEVTNPGDTASNVTATITLNFIFIPLPIILPQSVFGVMQGNVETRNINVQQSGDLTITATWGPGNVPLTFRLLKGTSGAEAIKDYGDQNQLKLKYRVTQQDIRTHGTNWKLEVRGSSLGNVQNVKPTMVLMPACY